MNETGKEDPIDESFRMLGAEDGWSFKVAMVEWPHPHEPVDNQEN